MWLVVFTSSNWRQERCWEGSCLQRKKLLSSYFLYEKRRRRRNVFATNNNNIKQENTILMLARSRLPEKQKAIYAGCQQCESNKSSTSAVCCWGLLYSSTSISAISGVRVSWWPHLWLSVVRTVIQIDVGVMAKAKYNCSHQIRGKQQWVFGVYNLETKRATSS